jgi:CRISPR-associated protein Cas6
MYWQDDSKNEAARATDEVVDLVFTLRCKHLPVDHVYSLFEAVQTVLPWLQQELSAGMHGVNVPASGNGWKRPDDPQALLHLSKRTRFELRVPKHRIDDAKKLVGEKLDVCGYAFELGSATERPLSILTTLFARNLATGQELLDEEEMLHWVSAQLEKQGITPRKMLCGTEHFIDVPAAVHPENKIHARSLMIADLDVEESLWLQQHGLGPYRHLGCGLFIPHKGIDDLRKEKE